MNINYVATNKLLLQAATCKGLNEFNTNFTIMIDEIDYDEILIKARETLSLDGIFIDTRSCYGLRLYSIEGVRQSDNFWPFVEIHRYA